MSGILPLEVQEFGAVIGARRRPRSLSARRVRRIVQIGQRWEDARGDTWRVANIHRKDGLVHLRGRIDQVPVPVSVFPTFAELGRRYRLTEEEAR